MDFKNSNWEIFAWAVSDCQFSSCSYSLIAPELRWKQHCNIWDDLLKIKMVRSIPRCHSLVDIVLLLQSGDVSTRVIRKRLANHARQRSFTFLIVCISISMSIQNLHFHQWTRTSFKRRSWLLQANIEL